MRPFTEFPAEAANKLRYVLFDIDDTATTGGKLTAEAYSAMWALHDCGLLVIPVTGRPAGWCDLIIREWPAAAVVGENGAFAYYWDGREIKTVMHPAVCPDPQPRLREIAEAAMAAVPGCRIARDQFSRLYDIAIDFREDEPKLSLAEAERIKQVCEAMGAVAKVSSIHVNAWFGDYSKAGMSEHLLREVYGDGDYREASVFFGDSPNDEPMFRAFPNSAGVANIRPFADTMAQLPAFVTTRESGAGFAEAARRIVTLRRGV